MSASRELKWYGWGLVGKEYDLSRRNNFWPYLNERLNITETVDTPPIDLNDIKLPPADEAGLAEHLEKIVGPQAVRKDHLTRVQHSFGKSYLDLIRIRNGFIENPPDLIVYPENEAQVLAILRLAVEMRAAVIPFGGGTSVVGGVEALRDEGHTGAITLNLTRLNRVLNIDEVSLLATIEAGIFGPELERQLQAKGFTLGHYPQSFEFSTLGGWVATRSAGQQSNRYGRVEDMVNSITIASPEDMFTTLDAPASAAGPSLKQLLIGSEGLYGVITKTKMRINRVPKAKIYHGVLFKDFFFGAQAIREMNQQGIVPAMARLSDQAETEAMSKMRAESESIFESALLKAGKWYLKNQGYAQDLSVMVLGFEDDDAKARADMKAALEICRAAGGRDTGSRIGEHWYRERFELPYLRDKLLDHGIMIDTLETATTWGNLFEVYNQVKEALTEALKSFQARINPMIFCHISHSYHDGASLYFTFLAKQARDAEVEQWYTAKAAASEAILSSGGTISHHHGVGRDHARWAKREFGQLGAAAFNQVKRVFDPSGILNPGKLLR